MAGPPPNSRTCQAIPADASRRACRTNLSRSTCAVGAAAGKGNVLGRANGVDVEAEACGQQEALADLTSPAARVVRSREPGAADRE